MISNSKMQFVRKTVRSFAAITAMKRPPFSPAFLIGTVTQNVYLFSIGASWVEGVWAIALIAPIGASGGEADVCDNHQGKAKSPLEREKRTA